MSGLEPYVSGCGSSSSSSVHRSALLTLFATLTQVSSESPETTAEAMPAFRSCAMDSSQSPRILVVKAAKPANTMDPGFSTSSRLAPEAGRRVLRQCPTRCPSS